MASAASEIDLGVRLFHLADVVEVHHRSGGVAAAARLRGPALAASSLRAWSMSSARPLESCPAKSSTSPTNSSRDRRLAAPLSDEEFDAALVALGDFTDLRSRGVRVTRVAFRSWRATAPGR